MKKESILKWMVLISFAALAFYLVCPKYEYVTDGHIRINKITGKTCIARGKDEQNVLVFDQPA